MPIVNNIKKQVDLPVWEWTRQSPSAPAAASTASASCSCVGDSSVLNEFNGRYIYYLLGTTSFARYDTVADSYQVLTSLPTTSRDAATMRFMGDMGYYNRVISADSNTIVTGLPSGRAAVGYKIRIISGKGAGQERIITSVSDPWVADFGNATAGAVTSLTDSNKNWLGSAASSTVAYSGSYTGATANINGMAGYVVRTIPFGTGPNQVRKILYNSATVLTVSDPGIQPYEPYCNVAWIAPAAGTLYQIESSTITVDTAWDIVPDQTSRFMIHSGAIILISGAGASPFYTMQYYDILHDAWYTWPAIQNIITGIANDACLESFSDTCSTWWRGKATSGSATTLSLSSANWTKNEWANYYINVYSGTGKGQIARILSNTDDTLVFSALAVPADSTSRFEILGYDAGTSSGSNAYNTLIDSTKSWTSDQYCNYAVRILSGKGAGQLRRILSNTSTTLTLYRGWNITPDNTSIYAIQGDRDTMLLSWGGSSEVYQISLNAQMIHHGRMFDYGTACVLAALRCDSNHNIEDTGPIALSGLAGTTTITATSVQAHGLKVGDYVSIRGVISAAADVYNVTGLYQITSVPSTTTFTYTPYAAGTGTYAYLTALSTTVLTDASKDFRDIVSSATNTSITFARATPSNINGWFVAGTNVTPGTRVVSGAGTTTVQLSGGSSTPSGTIVFCAWSADTAAGAAAIVGTYSSGGGAGVATVTLTTNIGAVDGWYVTGTGIAVNTYVTSGGGTSIIVLSNACTGAVSGNLTFYPPMAAGKQAITTTALSAVTTGSTTSQISFISAAAAATISNLNTAASPPTAGTSRYVLTSLPSIGADFNGSNNNYYYGITTGGSTTTAADSNAFWATATGSASAQSSTVALSATAPGSINGWFITGTGISTGTRIISGAGTTTLTLSMPTSGSVSGVMTCCAWGPSGGNSYLVNKRVKITGGSSNAIQELIISSVTPASGTMTFGIATAVVAGGCYTILSNSLRAQGHGMRWAYNNSTVNSVVRGRYVWLSRGGASVGIDKIDLNTDKIIYVHTPPFTETLSTGSMYAYDGGDRIYYTKDITQRVFYLDVNTNFIYGAGLVPYVAGTAIIGNKMEIIRTAERLKFLWINRHNAIEHFRLLLLY